MKFQRLLVVGLVSSGILTAQGCSAFAPKTQTVVITASEPSAQITVDGQRAGTGSVTMELARNKKHTVLAEHAGRQGAFAINKKISGTGVLDIVGGILFLVPFIGCVTPGFWELDPTTVNVIIPPAAGTRAPGISQVTPPAQGRSIAG